MHPGDASIAPPAGSQFPALGFISCFTDKEELGNLLLRYPISTYLPRGQQSGTCLRPLPTHSGSHAANMPRVTLLYEKCLGGIPESVPCMPGLCIHATEE